jgi:arabinose-5-phosphate isomerase
MLVNEVMLSLGKFPVVNELIIFKEALDEMSKYKLGIVCIVDTQNKLLGVFTDGDIRRKLLTVQKPISAFFVDDIITHAVRSPLIINKSDSVEKAVEIMASRKIWDLPVVDDEGKLVGLLHLHPIVEALLKKKV